MDPAGTCWVNAWEMALAQGLVLEKVWRCAHICIAGAEIPGIQTQMMGTHFHKFPIVFPQKTSVIQEVYGKILGIR
jgi:hypothetical protein